MADTTSTYAVRFDSNAQDVGPKDAAALEELRRAVLSTTDNIRSLSAAQRSLRGSSDEVKAARESFKSQISSQRDLISQQTLALAKQGTTFEQLAAKERASVKAKKEHDDTLKTEAKRLADEVKRATADQRDNEKDARAQQTRELQLMATVAGVVKDQVIALTRAIVDSAVSFGQWVIVSANALRSMALLREAATGTAVDALHLGHQVEALTDKLSLTRAEANALYVDMVRDFSGTFVGGEGIVKLTEAVARANDALAGSGDKLRGIIDRSKNFGRVSITPFELQGTGLRRDDIAQELGKRLGVGLAQARAILAAGRAPIEQSIQAIADAVQKRFGSINLRKLTDLNVFASKLRDRLTGLTEGVNLDKLSPALSSMLDLLSKNNVVGKRLSEVVSDIGNAIVSVATGAAPIFKSAVEQFTLTALNLEIVFLRTKIAVKQALGPGAFNLDAVKLATDLFSGLGVAVLVTATAMGQSVVAAAKLLAAVREVRKALTEGWDGVGKAITEGLAHGIAAGARELTGEVEKMGEGLKASFRKLLGIHSPSRVFEEYGRMIPAGTEKGIADGAPRVQLAADRAVPAPASLGAGVAAGGGALPPLELHVHIHLPPGSTHETVERVRSPELLAALASGVRSLLQSQGIPTGGPVTP